MAKIIAIANQKGGVGKTTTTVNLSTCVAQAGKRVLCVDIDPQGNTTSGLGVDKEKPEHSVYDVLINGVNAKDACVNTVVDGLKLLPSRKELSGAEVELVGMLAREQVLKRALVQVAGDFDFMFIDCPPSLGLLTVNALTAANTLLAPIQCEYYALEGLSDLMNTVKLVRAHLNPGLDVEGVVLTMFDARTNLSAQVVTEVKKFFRHKVYKTIIPRSVRLSEAPSFGLPITLYDDKCSGAKAYQALAQELLEKSERA
ncbi:MAG TPA: ParA family protein [Clostridia bacterium]|nr:ParA family protein [Clostridia bacterium]